MKRNSGWLINRLTLNQQDDRVLVGIVSIVEQVAESVQQQADQIPYITSPSITPEHLLPWLGRFIDVPDSEHLPIPAQRDQVRDVGNLIHLRGTTEHVRTIVQPYADGVVTVSDDGGVFREQFAGRCLGNVSVSIDSLKYGTTELIEQLIRKVVPAHCTIRLIIGDSSSVMETL